MLRLPHVLLGLGFIIPFIGSAQSNMPPPNDPTAIAPVTSVVFDLPRAEIKNVEMGKDDGGAIRLGFFLENISTVDIDVTYGVQLISTSTANGELPAYVFPSETVTHILPGAYSRVLLPITIPSYLSGDYDVFVIAEDVSARRVTDRVRAGGITAPGLPGYQTSCRANIEGVDADNRKFTLPCAFVRTENASLYTAYTAVASIRPKGAVIPALRKIELPVNFDAQGEGKVLFDMSDIAVSGAYQVEVQLMGDPMIRIAPTVIVPVDLSGPFANIRDLTLNAQYIPLGGVATASLNVTSRGFSDLSYILELYDASGLCGRADGGVTFGRQDVRMNVGRECTPKTLNATVSSGENVVATRMVSWERGVSRSVSSRRNMHDSSIFFTAVLLLLAVAIFLGVVKGGGKSKHISAIALLIVSAGFILSPTPVHAGSSAYEAWAVWANLFVYESSPPELESTAVVDYTCASSGGDVCLPGETVNVSIRIPYGVTPAWGVTTGVLWFDTAVSGTGWSYSVPMTTGLTSGVFNLSSSFSAPATPGTYTSSGSLVFRPEQNPIGHPWGVNGGWSMGGSPAWNGGITVTGTPYTLCGLAFSPGFGCDTPPPIGNTFLNLSACNTAKATLNNSCTPSLSCVQGACPMLPPVTVTLANSSVAFSGWQDRFVEGLKKFVNIAYAGGAPILKTASCGGWLNLKWDTTGSPQTCVASGKWSGNKDPFGNSELHSPVTGADVGQYTIRCDRGTSSDFSDLILDVGVCAVPPTPGACGQADGHTFASTDSWYSGTFDQCDSGTSDNAQFPAPGGSVSWTCSGTPASPTCTATRDSVVGCTPVWSGCTGYWLSNTNSCVGACPLGTIPSVVTGPSDAQYCGQQYNSCIPVSGTPGACGQANGHNFSDTDVAYTALYDQCDSGTPSDLRFPDLGGSASWTCSGSPASGFCSATRDSAPICTGLENTYCFGVELWEYKCGCTGSPGSGWLDNSAYAPGCWVHQIDPLGCMAPPGICGDSTVDIGEQCDPPNGWSCDNSCNFMGSNGECNPAFDRQVFLNQPSGALCSQGNGPLAPPALNNKNEWEWTCMPSGVGSSDGCVAFKPAQTPTLGYTCLSGGQVRLRYFTPGALSYNLRLDTVPPSFYQHWDDVPSNSPFGGATFSDSRILPISLVQPYRFWVNAKTYGGTSAFAELNFSCPDGPPPSPTLNYTCANDGQSVRFTYSSTGAAQYLVRFNDPTDGDACALPGMPSWYCGVLPERLITTVSTTINMWNIIPGRTYEFWVHSSNGGAVWGTDINALPARVTVNCPAPKKLMVCPQAVTVPLGDRPQFTAYYDTVDPPRIHSCAEAVALLSSGVEDQTKNASWSSLDVARASVSNVFATRGRASTTAWGVARIRATYSGEVDLGRLTIVAAVNLPPAVGACIDRGVTFPVNCGIIVAGGVDGSFATD